MPTFFINCQFRLCKMNYHALIAFFGRGGLSSNGSTFYSTLAFVCCLEFMLDDLWILGSWSLRVILPLFTKFRMFYLFFSSKFIDLLLSAIFSTEDYPNRCLGSISLMFLKSRLLGMFIFPISLLLYTPLEF